MKINILGYGLMAKQIASLFYIGGYDTYIWNHETIDTYDFFRQAKLLSKFIKENDKGAINFTTSLDELEDNFTIETVVEDLDIKISIYNSLRSKITKGYFTNSSSYSPFEIGDDVGGLHFFNPIKLKLIEFFFTKKVYTDETKQVLDFLKSYGFDIIHVNKNRGYIGNYILFNEIASALKLVEKFDYSIDAINAVYKKLYDGRNVFTIIDLIGIDVVYNILLNLKEKDNQIYLPKCLEEALERNILGKKNKTSIKQIFVAKNSDLNSLKPLQKPLTQILQKK